MSFFYFVLSWSAGLGYASAITTAHLPTLVFSRLRIRMRPDRQQAKIRRNHSYNLRTDAVHNKCGKNCGQAGQPFQRRQSSGQSYERRAERERRRFSE